MGIITISYQDTNLSDVRKQASHLLGTPPSVSAS